ncbi:hypothetical protein WR25_00168 [Diploscapter pachys]|uniref:Uncharacterized protein n=1 Tax=Diploscapter pachys TaxID=2018661 RepID=A0A2A2JLD1_9BILA|nr:hypothetical protein WR25_00168 [Diploscapter pachys]
MSTTGNSNNNNKVSAIFNQAIEGLRPTRRAKNTVTATTRNSEQKQRNEVASRRYERRSEDDGLTAAEKWTRMMAIQYKYNNWMGVETGRDALAEEGNYTTTGFEDEIEYENYLKCIEAQLEEDDTDGEDIEAYRISTSIDATKTHLLDENGVLRCKRNYAPRRWKIEPMRDIRRRQREEAKKKEETTRAKEQKEAAQKKDEVQKKQKQRESRTNEEIFFEDYGDYLQQIDVNFRKEQEKLRKEREEVAHKMSLVRRGSLTSEESRGSSRSSIEAAEEQAAKHAATDFGHLTYNFNIPLVQLPEQDENAATFVPAFLQQNAGRDATLNASSSAEQSNEQKEYITYDDNGYPLEFFLEL